MRGDALRFQFWRASQSPSRSVLATIRASTTVGGFANPPTLIGATLATAAHQGDVQVNISAISAFGRLVAGDTLIIGTDGPLVAADTESNPIVPPDQQGFTAVPLQTPMQAPYPAGQPVTPIYAADAQVYAVISSYPDRLIDGSLILAEDLMLTIATYDSHGNNLAAPVAGSTVMVGADLRTVISVRPGWAGNTVVSYTMQAR